jgi:hypothetical protein
VEPKVAKFLEEFLLERKFDIPPPLQMHQNLENLDFFSRIKKTSNGG